MNEAATAPATQDQFRRLVLDELERALQKGFDGSSERQRRLLTYLVHEELDGRGVKIKAYAIATQVFNRTEDFDAQTDSIVRVEIGRLRRALERYYLTSGADAKATITIPKGQYRPIFSVATTAPAATGRRSGWRPKAAALALAASALAIIVVAAGVFGPFMEKRGRKTSLVAVAPFSFVADREGQAFVGAGLQAELAGVLSEFDWLSVVPLTPELAKRADEEPASLNADFLLRSSVRLVGDNISTNVLLLDGHSGAVVWTRNYDLHFRASEIIAMERDIAARIGSDLGHPLGVLASIERTRMALDEFKSDDAFICHLRALQFWTSFTPADYAPARQCAENLRSREPPDPNMLAELALLVLDPDHAVVEGRSREETLADAARLSKRAYDLNPLGLLPRLARYNSALCSGDFATFREVGGAAIGDYPNNPLILTDYGARLVLGAHAPNEGLALIARAREITSKLMPADAVAPAVEALRKNQTPDLAGLRQAGSRSASPTVGLLYFAAAAAVGDFDEIGAAARKLAEAGFANEAAAASLVKVQCWSEESRRAVETNLAKGFRSMALRRGGG